MPKKSVPIAKVLLVVLTSLIASAMSFAQNKVASSDTLSQTEIDRIVKAFTSKETEFRTALNVYSFKRDAMIQSLGMGGQVTGEYHRVSNFTFDDQGNRYEKISFFPMPSFGGVTPEDLEDLGGIQPFALEPSKIDKYNIKYVGKEKIDELNLYVFEVTPNVVFGPSFGLQARSGRNVRNRISSVAPSVTVSGNPVCAWTIPLNCHPPARPRARPLRPANSGS